MKNSYILLLALLICISSYAKKTTFSEIEKLKVAFEKKHAIALYIKDIPRSTWKLEYKIVTKDFYQDLFYFIPILDKELSKYPQSFFKKTRLRGIALVRSLSVFDQYRSGIPDFNTEVLFYDFFAYTDFEVYQKSVIHHEFYHMIEQQFNGNPYWKDPAWMTLNTPKFKYGSGGWSQQQNRHAYDYTHPQQGFVNLYSMSGVEEDKAEIFATLFTKENLEVVLQWSKRDNILKSKIKYMKSFLENIDSIFNKQYWESYNQ